MADFVQSNVTKSAVRELADTRLQVETERVMKALVPAVLAKAFSDENT